jgi:hypothetical protein
MKNTIKTIPVALIFALIGSFVVPTSTFATLPEVLTVQANPISQTSATLHASFDANGASDIDVRFEYGTTPLFGSTTTYTNYMTQTGTHDASISVNAGTTYYFRAMAVADGPGYGTTLSFTTPSYTLPNMLTTSATNTQSTSATLNGFYNGNNGGTVTTWFQYANNSSFIGATNTPDISQTNNSGSFSANISGLSQNTTYYFRAIGQNSGGTTLGQPVLSFTTGEENGGGDPIDECTIDYFNASDNTIDEGDDATLSWTTSNCDTVYLSGDGISGYYDLDDSVSTDNLYNDETYTLTATGNGNTDTQSETIEVDEDNGGGGNNDECEITDFEVSPSTIFYGGYVTISWETTDCDDVEITGGDTNDDYGNDGEITSGPIYNNTTFHIYAEGDEGDDSDSDSVSIATDSVVPVNNACSDGIDNDGDGKIDTADAGCTSIYDDSEFNISFFNPVYNPPVNTTVTKTIYAKGGGDNMLNLVVESNADDVCRSDIYQSTTTYKNVSGMDLTNVILRIKLPENVNFRSTSSGTYLRTDHTVTVNIKTIKKGAEGVVYVSGDVRKVALAEDIAVTEAVASFANPKTNITENAIAYNVQDANYCGNSLAGLALFGGNFFPTTLVGWLIFIMAIAGLLIIAREFYGPKNRHQTAH